MGLFSPEATLFRLEKWCEGRLERGYRADNEGIHMDLTELTPEQQRHLERAVNEQVVKITHPDLADGWDLWWRQDYERFVAKYPEAEQELRTRPASLQEAAPLIDLLDPSAPTFALFSKGFLRNRWEV